MHELLSEAGAPLFRDSFAYAWTGTDLVIWGGAHQSIQVLDERPDAARYTLGSDAWAPIDVPEGLTGVVGVRGVWTGDFFVTWGGDPFHRSSAGHRYDPKTGAATRIAVDGAPAGRFWHGMVWTGDEVIVWGGTDISKTFGDGARYDPSSDSWAPLTATGAPQARRDHGMVWTGSQVAVWGGAGGEIGQEEELLQSGALYDPVADRWREIPSAGAPSPRASHTTVWTGQRLLVFGGRGPGGSVLDHLGDGALLDVDAERWTPIPATNAPSPRPNAAGVPLEDGRVLVFGGCGLDDADTTGAILDENAAAWTPVCPSPRVACGGAAVLTPSGVLFWGGEAAFMDPILLSFNARQD